MTDKPVEVEGEPPSGESFGTWLRQQREMREIHLGEIADRTKISLRYLRAMEQDKFDLLPGHVFVKGFLREYAKYVGLNPDEVVNFYLSTQTEPEEGPETIEEAAPTSLPWGRGLLIAILALILLAVISYVVFLYLSGEREQAITDAPPFLPVEPPAAVEPRAAGGEAAAGHDTERATESEDVVAPTAAAAQAAERPEDGATESTAPLQVTLDFSEDCWVEVLVDDGARRVDRRFVQGESLTLPAQSSVEILTLGNAGGVSLQVNGVPFPLEASSGQVQRNVRIDLETLRRLGGTAPSEPHRAAVEDG